VKWFFLASFVAGIQGECLERLSPRGTRGVGLRAVLMVAFLLFFIYGAREVYGDYREAIKDNDFSQLHHPNSLEFGRASYYCCSQ